MTVDTSGALAGKTVIAIDGGSYHCMALTSDGRVFTWGILAIFGFLGNGTYTDSSSPVAVDTSGLLSGKAVTAISAGDIFSMVIAGTNGSAPVTPDVPDIAVFPTNLDFGTITVGTTNQLSLAITNVGAAMLTVSSLVISNSATFAFIASSIPFSLNPGESMVIVVQFRPATLGTHNGLLTLGSNDPDEPSLVVPLTGQATTSSVPNLVVAPGALNFGAVGVGQTNSVSLLISNSGAATLNVTSLAVSNAAFSLATNPAPFNLVAGTGLSLSVRYHPPAATDYYGTLTIGSSDPDEPSHAVPLAGSTLTVSTQSVALAAWGDNSWGAFGNGGNFSANVPVPVTTTGALAGKTIVAVASGSYHSLALTSDGKVFGWGAIIPGRWATARMSSGFTPFRFWTARWRAGLWS